MSKYNLSSTIDTAQSVPDWLRLLHTNGYELELEELLQYRHHRALSATRKLRMPARGRGGNQLSKIKGRGMEFDEVRHYQSGDDIRAIDWRVTARTGQTHTKLYREEKERPVFFLVDLSPSMFFGSRLLFKSVQAAHVAAALAWQAAYRGDRVGGLVFNQQQHFEVKPMGRDKGVLRFLHPLVQGHQQQTQPASRTASNDMINNNLQRMRHLVKTGAQVYIISDFHHLADSALRDLRAISRHNAVQAILIQDPLEQALPDVSATKVQAVDDDFVRDFWLGDKRTNALYAQQAEDWFQQRKALLQQARIHTSTVSASLPLPLQWEALNR